MDLNWTCWLAGQKLLKILISNSLHRLGHFSSYRVIFYTIILAAEVASLSRILFRSFLPKLFKTSCHMHHSCFETIAFRTVLQTYLTRPKALLKTHQSQHTISSLCCDPLMARAKPCSKCCFKHTVKGLITISLAKPLESSKLYSEAVIMQHLNFTGIQSNLSLFTFDTQQRVTHHSKAG